MNVVFGVLAEHAIALGEQLLEARELAGRIAAIAIERQLEPALVVHVDGLEELLRLRGVDEHGHPKPAADLPDWIELRIVDASAASRPLCESAGRGP